MKLKKIALIVPSLEKGGGVPSVANFLYNVIIRSAKYDVLLISLSTSAKDELSVSLLNPRSWFLGVNKANEIWRERPFIRIGAFLSEFEFQRYRPRTALNIVLRDCDLIQVVAGSPAWANALIGSGKPISLQVATTVKAERYMRDKYPRSILDLWRKAMTTITGVIERRAIRSVNAIQVENHWMLKYIEKISGHQSSLDLKFAPPGVDTKLFTPLIDRPIQLNPYILFVGRLDDPRKNPLLLLDAFIKLPPTLNHVRLVTAGASRPPELYWIKVNENNLQNRVVHIHQPNIDDLIKLYQQAQIFALPSNEEGLGMVILEAMSCGIPIVATRCGGPESIITNGCEGYLVPIDGVNEMADRLIQLLEDQKLNLNMGKRARETAVLKFDEIVTGEAFIDIWDSLLSRIYK